MYNLLKRSSQNQDEWEQSQDRLHDASFLRDRIFEFTDDVISGQFGGKGQPRL